MTATPIHLLDVEADSPRIRPPASQPMIPSPVQNRPDWPSRTAAGSRSRPGLQVLSRRAAVRRGRRWRAMTISGGRFVEGLEPGGGTRLGPEPPRRGLRPRPTETETRSIAMIPSGPTGQPDRACWDGIGVRRGTVHRVLTDSQRRPRAGAGSRDPTTSIVAVDCARAPRPPPPESSSGPRRGLTRKAAFASASRRRSAVRADGRRLDDAPSRPALPTTGRSGGERGCIASPSRGGDADARWWPRRQPLSVKLGPASRRSKGSG